MTKNKENGPTRVPSRAHPRSVQGPAAFRPGPTRVPSKRVLTVLAWDRARGCPLFSLENLKSGGPRECLVLFEDHRQAVLASLLTDTEFADRKIKVKSAAGIAPDSRCLRRNALPMLAKRSMRETLIPCHSSWSPSSSFPCVLLTLTP